MVVDIINDYSIKVYRLGWLKDKKSKLFKNLDSNLMGIIFPKFLELIDSDIKETKLIPIMDGLDNKISQIFSQYVKQLDILRQNINSNNLTIKNSQNIYGEVFYADSKFSILTQFVDMTSYMLHCKDYKDFRKNYGIFKGNIIEISERIRPELVNGKYYFTEVSI
jgi:hypothetical protein